MTGTPRRGRGEPRGFSAVELAAGVSVVLSLLAIAIPTFVHQVKSSRFVEPTENLAAIATEAVAYATTHATKTTLPLAFPHTAPLTPASPPRGHLAVDPPGTWDDPTWAALHFPTTAGGFAFADGDPHAFAFAFDSTPGTQKSTFVAHARGDLDGDGATSTFEVRGQDTPGEGPTLIPGMYVENELE